MKIEIDIGDGFPDEEKASYSDYDAAGRAYRERARIELDIKRLSQARKVIADMFARYSQDLVLLDKVIGTIE